MKVRNVSRELRNEFGIKTLSVDQWGWAFEKSDPPEVKYIRPLQYRSKRALPLGIYKEGNPLPYPMESYRVDAQNADPLTNINNVGAGKWTRYIAAHLNRCYGRVKESVHNGTSAELLTFLGEGREALKMLARRGPQMWTAYKQLRKWDITGMLATLGMTGKTPKRPAWRKTRNGRWVKVRTKHRDIYHDPFYGSQDPGYIRRRLDYYRRVGGTTGDVFLEYSYGWAPAIGDIVDSCKVLARGPAAGRFKERITGRYNHTASRNTNNGEEYAVTSRFSIGGTFLIENPNLVLAEQLGFVNPVSTGWNLIPFSFLVDQVANVDQFLSSWTDFLGYKVSDAWWNHSHYVVCRFWRGPFGPLSRVISSYTCVSSQRLLGLYSPSLQWTSGVLGFAKSVKRAANNFSLILALLKG